MQKFFFSLLSSEYLKLQNSFIQYFYKIKIEPILIPLYNLAWSILACQSNQNLYYYTFCKRYNFNNQKVVQEMLRIGEKYKGFVSYKELQNMRLNEYCILLNAIYANIEEDRQRDDK